MTERAPLALALALALVACGGGATPEAARPKAAAVDEAKAENEAKGLVTEVYDKIGHGDTDGLIAVLVEPLVVFGPRRADAMATRGDAIVALKLLVDPRAKKKHQLRSGALAVVPAPGGRSAWAFDIVTVAGEPLAITSVLTNADDIWLVAAASIATTPTAKAVRAAQKQDAIVPPGMSRVGKQDAQVAPAIDKLTRGLVDPAVWGDDLTKRSDAIVIGPSASDVTRGKQDIKQLWKKRVKANVRAVAVGDVAAGATADGQLAWASVPVVRFADDDEPLPLRVFAVFEKRGPAYTMIALHESLAVDQPGAGTILKKTPPPASLQKVEAPKPAEDSKSKPKAKPKSKKKRRPKPEPDPTVSDD